MKTSYRGTRKINYDALSHFIKTLEDGSELEEYKDQTPELLQELRERVKVLNQAIKDLRGGDTHAD